ncbi:unnamed protein product, partial [Darwinula stevensoni]
MRFCGSAEEITGDDEKRRNRAGGRRKKEKEKGRGGREPKKKEERRRKKQEEKEKSALHGPRGEVPRPLAPADRCNMDEQPVSRTYQYRKADVLEMTLNHLKRVRSLEPSWPASSMEDLERFRAGFTQCATEVSGFLRGGKVKTEISCRLLGHLSQCMRTMEADNFQNLFPPPPLCPSAWNYRGPPPPPGPP